MNGKNTLYRRLIWSSSLQLLLTTIVLTAVLCLSAPAGAQATPGIWMNFTAGNDINAVAVDPRTQEVWVATNGGVVRWDPQLSTYTKYTVLDGLATNRFRRRPESLSVRRNESVGVT